MRTKIKAGEINDRCTLYPITGYNNNTTGLPDRTYGTAVPIYAKVRRTLASTQEGDKTKVVNNWSITTRIDSIAYKPDDKIVWSDFTMHIKDIQQIDIYYQNLICYNEY